jgi:copper chaperone NosL
MKRSTRRGWLRTAGLLVSMGLLGGCLPDDRSRPPTLRLGEEACAECRMIVSDGRFAAALARDDGQTLKFDDFGCLIRHENAALRPGTTYWVRDFRTEQWLNAGDAVFLRARSITTPMGYGLSAVAADQAEEVRQANPESQALRLADVPGFLAAHR